MNNFTDVPVNWAVESMVIGRGESENGKTSILEILRDRVGRIQVEQIWDIEVFAFDPGQG
jgi:hypothetical protein